MPPSRMSDADAETLEGAGGRMMGTPRDLSQERSVSGRWSSLERWVDLDISILFSKQWRSRLGGEREASASKKGDGGLSP